LWSKSSSKYSLASWTHYAKSAVCFSFMKFKISYSIFRDSFYARLATKAAGLSMKLRVFCGRSWKIGSKLMMSAH